MYNFDFIRKNKEYFELRIPFENIEEINNCYEWTVADRPDEVIFYVQHYLDTKGMYNFYISTCFQFECQTEVCSKGIYKVRKESVNESSLSTYIADILDKVMDNLSWRKDIDRYEELIKQREEAGIISMHMIANDLYAVGFDIDNLISTALATPIENGKLLTAIQFQMDEDTLDEDWTPRIEFRPILPTMTPQQMAEVLDANYDFYLEFMEELYGKSVSRTHKEFVYYSDYRDNVLEAMAKDTTLFSPTAIQELSDITE